MEQCPLPIHDINKSIDLSQIQPDKHYPLITSNSDISTNFSTRVETKKLQLLNELIDKRKIIRNSVIGRLEQLISFCKNNILESNINDLPLYPDDIRIQTIMKWKMMYMELVQKILLEYKNHFTDTLFLRNESLKSMVSVSEAKILEQELNQSNLEQTINSYMGDAQ